MSSSLKFVATPVKDIAGIVADAHAFHATHATLALEWRKGQLKQLHKLLKENEKAICDAAFADLGVEPNQIFIREIALAYNDITLALNELDSWAAPHKPSVDLAYKLDGAQIRSEPKGVVANIAPWNYPVQLSIVPLVGAIAAGCCMVIKPSELAEQTAAILAKLVPLYLEPRAFKVVNGAVAETTELLAQRFDHILYTGNGQVARIVAAAAAKNLTPLTLELGGKSPALVDATADLAVTARRLAWGAFTNSGQTCVRPDYVLATPDVVDKLVAQLKIQANDHFGEKNDARQGTIINDRHFARVAKLLDDTRGKIEFGNTRIPKEKYLSPTVVTGVKPDDSLMQSEIFGPILPICVMPRDEMIRFVNSRDKPLALYVFTADDAFAERVLTETSSGSAVVNDVLMQCVIGELPFGGVGESGMGAYHGKHSFDTFSHKKSILKKNFLAEGLNDLRYPPITEKKISWLKWISISEPREKWFGLF
jgi:acyl-CoA reductase-like NAD-dependent aldehyde dehydrogenase